MNGPHAVLEAALEYGNVPEEVRRSFRVEMGYELALWATDFVDLDDTEDTEDLDETFGDELSLPEGLWLDKDPDLWLIRDERGDVACGVSAETAMEETISRIAWAHVAAREEIREEAGGG